MTASLTHIVKSDQDEIEVEYYSHKDWQEIKRHANEYEKQKAISEPAEFMRASHELVEMVEKRRLKVRSSPRQDRNSACLYWRTGRTE